MRSSALNDMKACDYCGADIPKGRPSEGRVGRRPRRFCNAICRRAYEKHRLPALREYHRKRKLREDMKKALLAKNLI